MVAIRADDRLSRGRGGADSGGHELWRRTGGAVLMHQSTSVAVNAVAAALAPLRQAVANHPHDPLSLLALGDALRRCGEAEAEDVLRQAIAVAPGFTAAHCALANVLLHRGAMALAAQHLAAAARFAPEMSPAMADVWLHIGLLRRIEGYPAAALEAFEKALALTTDNKAAQLGRCLCLLRLGRWREGFSAYESRWQGVPQAAAHADIPRWRGEPLAGRRLLVWHEQGTGDSVMVARLLLDLHRQGALLSVEAPSALIPLLMGMPWDEDAEEKQVRFLVQGQAPGPQDFQAPIMDLPGLLGLTPDGIPWRGPYIAADAARIVAWRTRLAVPQQVEKAEAEQVSPHKPRLRIGLSWAGNPAHPGDRWRSPGLAPFLALLGSEPERRWPDVQWVALQAASGRQILVDQALPNGTIDAGGMVQGWDDTMAIVAELDLVIVPDSAIAHIAGAMGRPTWMLLSADTDWRWGEDAPVTPWYPSMRLFRQPRINDWESVFTEVGAALKDKLAR
jgi:hypothetical protein